MKTLNQLRKALVLWLYSKITYYEITYGPQSYFYKGYSKTERKAIAYNIANEYLNF